TWSSVTTVSIESTAPGQVVPSGNLHEIYAPQSASVRILHVAEGDYVKAGDLLVEFDERLATAELKSLTEERRFNALEQRLLELELGGTTEYDEVYQNWLESRESLVSVTRARDSVHSANLAQADAMLVSARAEFSEQAAVME